MKSADPFCFIFLVPVSRNQNSDFSKQGNFFLSLASNGHQTNCKGEYTMDDLKFDPSALLIVGMLIGVVCTLL